MREEHWRNIGGHADILYLIKKLLHIVLVILKPDSADVNWLLTLLRPMPSKHCKVWSVYQWYQFQIPFWATNLSGKPFAEVGRAAVAWWVFSFTALLTTSWKVWSILALYKVIEGKPCPQMGCRQRRVRIIKIHLFLGDG